MPLPIETHQDRLGLDEIEGDVAGVREALVAVAVDVEMRQTLEQRFLEAVAHGAHAGLLVGERLQRQFRRAAQADDRGDILRAAALAAFLAAADDVGHDLGASLDVKHAHALGRMELVARHGEKIDVALGDVAQVDLAGRLHRVGMEKGRPCSWIGGGEFARLFFTSWRFPRPGKGRRSRCWPT